MGKINASIVLFSLAGIFYLISTLTGNEHFALMCKPVIIPSILFFYLNESKRKFNFWFIASLLIFFIGDMLYLINLEEYYLFGLIFYLAPYLIVLGFLFNDIKLMWKRKPINKSDFSFLIILAFLIYLLISVLSLLDSESREEFVYFLIFGVELLLMGIIASLLFVNESSRVNMFLVITISLFILSDIFFILNKSFLPLLIFKVSNIITQILSYYFFTKYFLERELLKK